MRNFIQFIEATKFILKTIFFCIIAIDKEILKIVEKVKI